MTWGAFKHYEIEDIPSGYLRWLAENCDDDVIASAADEEFRFRSDNSEHFWDDKPHRKMTEKDLKVIDKLARDTVNERKEKPMNEDFVPVGQGSTTSAPIVTNKEMEANLELAKAASDTRLLNLIQSASVLKQLKQFARIETQQQYDQAIDAFNSTKELVKDVEKIRHEYVDFPTSVAKLINGFFKPIRDGIESTKDHLGKIIDAKKRVDFDAAKALAKQQREKAAEIGEPVTVETSDGVREIVIGADVLPPNNVVSSAKGAKVHTRIGKEVKIVDLVAFLKACVSKAERNQWLAEHVESLVTVNESALLSLIKEGGKKKVPGVELVETSRTV